jgi:hypothetical protein
MEVCCFLVSSWGRCAGPPWRRENGVAPVRDADVSVMPVSSWSQYGAGGHRQELSIVWREHAGQTLWPCGPSGRAWPGVVCRLGRVLWSCCMSGVLGWISGRRISRRVCALPTRGEAVSSPGDPDVCHDDELVVGVAGLVGRREGDVGGVGGYRGYPEFEQIFAAF